MIRKKDDDLFEESTMTFGEHLDELRTALIRALRWLGIGCVIGLAFGNHVVGFIKRPLSLALEKYFLEQNAEAAGATTEEEKELFKASGMIPFPYYIKVDNKTEQKENSTSENVPANANRVQELILGDLLHRKDFYTPKAFPNLPEKLQKQVASISTMTDEELVAFNRELLQLSHSNLNSNTPPGYERILLFKKVEDDERVKAKSMNSQEPFMIYLKGSFLLGFVVSCPMVFYHLWSFVAEGLYPNEKKYVHVFMPVSIGLFLAGAGLAYFVVFKYVLDFLLSYNKWLDIDPELRIDEFLSLALMLPIGFGLSFQLPLVMLFLERIGVLNVQSYLAKWRMAVLVIFIIAAILTPADPYSMMLMAGPLTILYFGGILMCHLWPRPNGETAISVRN